MNRQSPKPRCPGGRSSGTFALVCVGALGVLLPAREPPGPGEAEPQRGRATVILDALAESRPEADARQMRLDLETGEVVAYLSGHVTWTYRYEGETVELIADRLLVEARKVDGSGPGEPPAGGPTSAAEASGASDELALDFRFFADGNVRIAVPEKETFFEADSFYYEHSTGRGVARGVRLKTTYSAARGFQSAFQSKSFSPGQPDPAAGEEGTETAAQLSVRADLLRMEGFERFSGEGVEVSTCEYGVPHYSLRAASVEVEPVPSSGGPAPGKAPPGPPPEPAAPGESEEADDLELALTPGWARQGGPGRDYIIDPESTWLHVAGHRLAPVPVSRWDTRWHSHMPLRSVDIGASNQFGLFAGAEWNLNYALDLLPLERFLPLSVIEEKAELGFETSGMEKRGFGYGPRALYGTKPSRWDPWQLQLNAWNYYGEAQYYHVDDQGDEDRTTEAPPPREERYWGHVWHRQSIPYLGMLDLEYSRLSDRAFLGEYFEEVEKEEKEQETLAYLRRNIDDNLAVTALYQTRTNDFQTQTERLPEGRLFLMQQPVFSTGLYTDLQLQGAYLHNLSDNALGIPDTAYGRYDLFNEWSYPFGWNPYFRARPFALMNYTYYGEVADPTDGSEDRATFGAGVTVSQEWSRVFHFAPDSFLRKVLGASDIKHSMVPEMTYLNVFSNDLAPQDVIQVDAIDEVNLTEQFVVGLRNEIAARETRRSGSTTRALLGKRDLELETVAYSQRPLLDSSVRFALFPQPTRDNAGETSSLLIFDNTAAVTPDLYLRGWFELDPNEELEVRRADASATWEAIPEKLWLTFGDRYTRSLSEYLYGTLSLSLTEKWDVDLFGSYDIEREKGVEYNVVLSRIFHRFVVSLEYSMDVGEDYNQTLYVTVSPLELWRPARARAWRGRYY